MNCSGLKLVLHRENPVWLPKPGIASLFSTEWQISTKSCCPTRSATSYSRGLNELSAFAHLLLGFWGSEIEISWDGFLYLTYIFHRRSQRPRGLRHELSSPAQTLKSWIRTSLKTRMSVCVYSVFVLFCVQVAALWRADPPSKDFYRLCIWLRNWKSRQGPTKDCRAMDI
jgi:hypothetical protein